MSFFWGDGFDLYAAPADAYASGTYWDSGGATFTLVAGRFSGSRGIQNVTNGVYLRKASGQNDSVHHVNVAYNQSAALSGSNTSFYIGLFDGATSQCTIMFRQDGAIVLKSGGVSGTVIATYTGAVTAINTWYGFEFEVVIHNTAGSFTVRKLGNTSNDFSLGSLNTRGGTANNYANQVVIGTDFNISNVVDDFLWRSDASSVPWAGELRCYTRMPASDASVQWTPNGAVVPLSNYPETAGTAAALTTTGKYLPFVAQCDGTVATVSLQCVTAATASIKCSIFASSAGAPTTVLGSAILVTNPGIGTTTFTFATPVAVTQGATYYVGVSESAASGTFASIATSPAYYLPLQNATAYASFPAANPTGFSAGTAYKATINITPTAAVNAPMVADAQQDAAASYVSSSTVGQTDLYGIAPISGTPTGIVGVTTRALCQKSDAGTRNLALRLRSGATDVTGASVALNTSFGWVWRTDLVDPATGAAWAAVAVNNLKIGQTVSA